jgi:PAS domain S-box-containing protein
MPSKQEKLSTQKEPLGGRSNGTGNGQHTGVRTAPVQPERPLEYEASFEDFFENACVGLHWVAADGTILRANRAELEMLGYVPEEYIGRNVREFHADAQAVEELLSRLGAGETIHNVAACLKRKDGSVCEVLISSNTCFRDGEFLHTRCVTVDVTDLRKAEQALARQTDLLELVTDAVPALISHVDAEKRYTYVNKAYEAWFGLEPEHLLGRTMWEVLGRKAYETVEPFVESALGGQAVQFAQEIPYEGAGTRFVQVHYVPDRGADGQVVGFHALITDLTELERTERELRDSELKLRTILDSLPAAVYTTDADGLVTHFNQAAIELAGRTPQLGKDQWCISWKLYRPDGTPLPYDECPMAIALKEERAIRGAEILVERPDGRTCPVTPFPTPLFDSDGKLIGGINMLVDISDQKEAARRIEESEHILRSFYESAPLLMGVVEVPRDDSDILHVYDSPPTEKFFGTAPGATGGKWSSELGAPKEAIKRWISYYRKSERTNQPVRFEYEHPTPQGPVWLSSVVACIGPARSGRTRFSYVTEDISERKRAEEALARKASEQTALFHFTDRLQRLETLEEVYEAALEAICGALGCDRASILLFDDSGVMRFVRWKGLSEAYRAAVEGHSPWGPGERRPRPIAIGDVEESDIAEELKQVVLGEGIRSLCFVPLVAKGRLIGKFMVYFDQPHDFGSNGADLAMMIAHQIAFGIEKKKAEARRDEAEKALKESEERYRHLLEVLPVAMYSCEAPTGRITYYNQHAAALWGREPNLGDTDQRFCGSFKLFLPDGRYVPHEECPMAMALVKGRSFRAQEVILEREDGTRITVLVNIDPIHDADGRVIGAINVFHDVSALKDAESRLKEADRRKDEFLAMLAHELRNPLAPIRSSLEYVLNSKAEAGSVHRSYEIMVRQVDHLSRLVDDLLDISRISLGKLTLRMERLDLRAMVRSAAEIARPSMEKAGQELRLDFPAEPVFVEGDADRLTQVFGNLLMNAYKFTPDGGRIRASVRVEGNQAIAEVEDSGAGIESEKVARIFDLFGQTGRFISHRPIGLGVGLALAKEIVEKHSGTIEAASDGPGQGSCFAVALPLLEETQKHAQERSNRVGRNEPAAKRILIVDDNVDAADAMALLLELEGHAVRVAYGGAQGIAEFEQDTPEILLLDLGMPDMDGYEVAKRVGERAGAQGCKLVAITGWGQETDLERTKKAGFSAHLVKPVTLDSVRKMIREFDRPSR